MGIEIDVPKSAFVYADSEQWILIELHPLNPPPGVYDDAIWFFDVNVKRGSLTSYEAAGRKQVPATSVSLEAAKLSRGNAQAHILRRTILCHNGDIIAIEARVFPHTVRGTSFLQEDLVAARRIVDSVKEK